MTYIASTSTLLENILPRNSVQVAGIADPATSRNTVASTRTHRKLLLVVYVGLSNASGVGFGARSECTSLYVRSICRNFRATSDQIRDAYRGRRIHLLLQ